MYLSQGDYCCPSNIYRANSSSPILVEIIGCVTPHEALGEGCISWANTLDGRFTTKSTYFLLKGVEVHGMFFLNDFDGLFIAYDVQAKTCFQDFVKSLAIDVTGTTRSKQLTPLAWVPPQFGWTKVNTYASIRISNQLATYVGAFRMLNRKWFIDFVSNLGSSSLLMEERWDADMEDYGFEYSDEEQEEQDVDIENQYYNSKGLVETDPEGALSGFAEVVRMEQEKAEWGFKALKQTVKLYYRLGRYKEMMEAYREMLTYIKSAVTRNYSEKCINSIMDYVSGSASQNFGLLQEFYQTTLQALEEAKNERLWFKTNLKLCKIFFDIGEYGRMSKILKELHKSCQREDGTDDHKKGTQLLEVYAIEIQMYTEMKNNKKLKQLYQKALTIKSAIPHPRIMGIIHECGGKMHMAERQWAEAATDFFEAFKNYDEAGNHRRIQCLKYLVLANMLMESEVNPFDGQEAKPYKNDPEILAMTNLIAAYQRNEILEFEKILKSNRRTIMDDPFIRNYIEDLLKNIRTQVLLKLIKPYTRIRIPFISKELNVPEHDVEQLLVSLILDNRIQGHIDQVNRLLERSDRSKGMKKYTAVDKWNTQLKSLYQTISNRVG
ncbi:hypothetical protein JHK87_053311 [Glycine soja]|nr:hypothetical protein JHK87_053311 [Glycine soja]